MRILRSSLAAIISLALASASVGCKDEPDAVISTLPPNPPVGSTGWVPIQDLRPTQFCVGMEEVQDKRVDLESRDSSELLKYLNKKKVSLVVGPGNTYWLVDGHHLATAMSLSNNVEKRLVANVLKQWSDLSASEFETAMIENDFFWPYDENDQGPHSFSALPEHLNGLKDDPYRTLAWKLKKEGGFEEVTSVPFQEFQWGRYLRKHVPLDIVKTNPDKALRLALDAAQLPEAESLPGAKHESDWITTKIPVPLVEEAYPMPR